MTLTKITTGGITDATIATADIAADAITGAKIADDAVGAEHIEVLDADLQMTDAGKIKLGTGNDLEIFHNGTSNIIEATNGDLNIRMNNSENAIVARQNGAAELYHNNVKKFETTSDGIESDSELHFKAPSSTTGEQVGRIEWWNESDAGVMAKIAVDRTAATAAPTDLVFSTSANIDTTANGGDGDITERMRIDSAGNVGIGVTPTMASGGGLHIRGPAGNQSRLHLTTSRSGDGTGDGFYIIQQGDESSNDETNFINYETASMKFSTSGTERMRVHSTGNVGINTTSPINRLEILEDTASAAVLRLNRTTNIDSVARDYVDFYRGGTAVGFIKATNSSVSYLTSSDYRLKENATAISDGITRLKTLKPYRFNFKAAPKVTVDGFFAHEVTAVPEAISGTKDEVDENNNPVHQGIDQSKLVPLLTAALQEAIAKIEVLETKVAALEAA